jgi:hypothetical protein
MEATRGVRKRPDRELQTITRKDTTMKTKELVAGFLALTLTLSTGAASLSVAAPRHGEFHATKECTEYTFLPGGFCSFTSPNLAGAKIFYDQAPGTPAGLLDSNVVLDAGHGNRAVGRCTLDLVTNRGLCTFSDGTGEFIGFEARIDVFCPDGVHCTWDGTYTYKP